MSSIAKLGQVKARSPELHQGSPIWAAGVQVTEPLLAASQDVHMQKAGTDIEQSGFETIWDTYIPSDILSSTSNAHLFVN